MMQQVVPATTHTSPNVEVTPAPAGLLQRACSCGGSPGTSGKCASCEAEEKLGIQPKLTIGAPNDAYEQEADRVADQVVSNTQGTVAAPIAATPVIQRMEASEEEEPLQRKPEILQRMEDDDETVQAKSTSIQRMEEGEEEESPQLKREPLQRMEGEDTEEETLQTKPAALQRMEGGEAEEEELQMKREPIQRMEGEEEAAVQMKAVPAPPKRSTTPPAATKAANAVTSGGHPLSSSELSYFEPRLGHDLSSVRLHTDATAGTAAKGINARAYTLRNHIAFAPGQYSPETTEGRRLLAHELTHTLQQRRSSGTAQTVQRSAYYWKLPNFRGYPNPGTRTHRYVQNILGIEARSGTALYSEMPIPGASRHGNTGFVDFYRSDTEATLGVEFSGAEPEFLNISRRSARTPRDAGPQRNGSPFDRSDHVDAAAPVGHNGSSACVGLGLPGRPKRGICRLDDDAPDRIEIGELKPADSAEGIFGRGQVGRYRRGVSGVVSGINAFIAANPAGSGPRPLFHPTTATGWTPSVTAMSSLALGDLDTSRPGKPVNAKPYLGDSAKGPAEPCRLHVKSEGGGVYGYIIKPDRSGGGTSGTGSGGGTGGGRRGAAGRGSTSIASVDATLRAVRSSLTEQPNATQANSSAARTRRGRGGRIRARDTFNFSTWSNRTFIPWRRTAERATGGRGRAAERSPSAEANQRFRDEGLRQIDLFMGGGSSLAPTGTRERTRELTRVQHWIDRGPVYGRLRATFGRSFSTLIRTFDRVRARIAERTRRTGRNLNSGGRGSGLRGAVLTAVKGLAITMLGLFVKDVAGRLMRAVQEGSSAFLRETFEGQMETLETQIAELEQIEEALRTGITERLEDEFGTQIELVESLLEDVESVASTLGAFGTVVELAKWGYRIAQCGVPPLLGCVIGFVASEIAAQALGLLIASCWFKREVLYPAVSGIRQIAELPGRIARAIGDRAREALPPRLRPMIGEVDGSPLVSSETDVDCDDAASNQYNLTPEQIRLASLLRRYDEDQVAAMFEALEHLGIATTDPDPSVTLSSSDVDFIERMLNTYSEADFERMIEQTEARRPSGRSTENIMRELDQSVGRAARGETDGGGGADAEVGGGVPSEEEQQAEIESERREVQRRLNGVDRSRARRDRREFAHSDWTGREVGDGFVEFVFGMREDGTLVGAYERITITGINTEGQFEITFEGDVRYYAESGTAYWTLTEDRPATTIDVQGGASSEP